MLSSSNAMHIAKLSFNTILQIAVVMMMNWVPTKTIAIKFLLTFLFVALLVSSQWLLLLL